MNGPALEMQRRAATSTLCAKLIAHTPSEQLRALNIVPMLVDAAVDWDCPSLDLDVTALDDTCVSALLAALIVTHGRAQERGIELRIIAGVLLEAVTEIVGLGHVLPIASARIHTESPADHRLVCSCGASGLRNLFPRHQPKLET